jgi:hypothetical protein
METCLGDGDKLHPKKVKQKTTSLGFSWVAALNRPVTFWGTFVTKACLLSNKNFIFDALGDGDLTRKIPLKFWSLFAGKWL